MPKVKVPRKSTSIDMTAMCDVAFLLLTFFMLTTKFKPDEPVQVTIPFSVSDKILPEKNMVQILVDADGKVFFGVDGQNQRMDMLDRMATAYKLEFSETERKRFALVATFGMPIHDLDKLLAMSAEERAHLKQPGIPIDSVNNELGTWLACAFRAGKGEFKFALKGDDNASAKVVKRIFDILAEQNIPKFNFITSYEVPPTGRPRSFRPLK